MKYWAMLTLPLLALAAPAASKEQAKNGAVAEPLRALQACRQVADAGSRLACFEAATEGLSQAVARKEVVIMDQKEIKETRRSLFGFSVPRISLFRGEGGQVEDEITATIASASSLGMGKWRLRLEDGATWVTTESIGFASDPKAGQKVVIKKGTLGSYFLRINGQRGVRGMRQS